MGLELFPPAITEYYELHEWKHAAAILHNDFPDERQDVVDVLSAFRLKESYIMTLGRRQTNIIVSQKRGHSHKPDEQYGIIEECSPGPFLELFARNKRPGWSSWGNEIVGGYEEHPEMEDPTEDEELNGLSGRAAD